MQSRGFTNYVVIALISLTLIPLELTWTRIFSAEFFYTFAFLVLSLAILGLGLGALALRLVTSLNRPALLGTCLSLAGLCALLGPVTVFGLNPDFSVVFSSWAMIGKLIITVLILMSAYFFGGMALAMLFKRNHDDMPRLYMADLAGAAAGVVIAIGVMNAVGTPVATMLLALPILVASFLVSTRWMKMLPVGVALIALALCPSAETLLEADREERAPVIYKHWDAMAKVKVYEYGADYRGINIDNVANSPVYRFDGNWEDTRPGETPWGINAAWLIQQFDSCVFLSLGAGGGSDVLQALAEGATEVHAVEINSHMNKMMISGDPDGYLPIMVPSSKAVENAAAASDSVTVVEPERDSLADSSHITLAEFSGHIYTDPRVIVVSEDARAYVRRFENKFDVIYSLSSNTWAALSSGAFALAENYLFTTEAFEDYWRALSDSGFLMMEHQVYMPRLVSEVIEALEHQGVSDPAGHFAIYNLPQMRRNIVLMSKRPLSDSLRYFALGELTPEKFNQIHLLYPPANDSIADNLINRIVVNGWEAVADSAPIDISPVTDDRPFVAQLGLMKNFTSETREKVIPYAEFQGFPLSKVTLLIILAVVIVVILPLNLVPYLRPGPKLKAIPFLFFFCIGLGFMAVEVVLIQKYSLLIGPSLHSIVTILMTLLLASAIGSRFANHVSPSIAFCGIILLLLLDAFAFHRIFEAAGGLEMAGRIVVTSVLVFPVGFFMGIPFPKATLRVGQLIDWGFAVNGAASVLGSILVLLIAFQYGFSVSLVFAAAMYLMAYLLFTRGSGWKLSVETGPPQVQLNALSESDGTAVSPGEPHE